MIKSILIVDDEIDIRETISDFVTNFLDIWDVVTAENGETAIDLLQEKEPVDLIITDFNMPVMNGYKLVKKIKASEYGFADIPIIMVTAIESKEQENLIQELITDKLILGKLSKPVDFYQLKNLIENI